MLLAKHQILTDIVQFDLELFQPPSQFGQRNSMRIEVQRLEKPIK
jgi:hypothetical protein